MKFHTTPDMMEQSYCLLLTCLPFRNWKMPHPDDMEFNVSLHRDRRAHHCAYKDGVRHEITISAHEVDSLHRLNETMAHEMIHIYEDKQGVRAHHGPSFQRRAKTVCRRNRFDPETF